MKLVSKASKKEKEKTALEKFSEQTFTVEFTGFEILALKLVANHVGGGSKVRAVFSNTNPDGNIDNLYHSIDCPSKMDAFKELENATKVYYKGGLYVDESTEK